MYISILIFSSAGLSLHTPTQILFAYAVKPGLSEMLCHFLMSCPEPKTCTMPLHRLPYFFFFFPFLFPIVWLVPTGKCVKAHRRFCHGIAVLFFEYFKNGDCTLHAAQSHCCELRVKKWKEASDTLVQSIGAIFVTNCLGRLMPR